MLTVHHLEHSRSHRILWLLEELEVEYEFQSYPRNPKTQLAPKELRDLHPLGKAPIVTHDGEVWAESGAVIETLLDEFGEGRLRPAEGTPEFRRYRYWMHYAEGSAMAPLLLKTVFSELPKQGPALARPVLKAVAHTVDKEYIGGQVQLHVDYWEEELAERPFFAGEEFTAADIQMSFPVVGAVERAGVQGEYPKVRAYVERLKSRPAYQRAVEKGGPPV